MLFFMWHCQNLKRHMLILEDNVFYIYFVFKALHDSAGHEQDIRIFRGHDLDAGDQESIITSETNYSCWSFKHI